MTDSLTVFGTDFTGVTGIKATGTGNGTLTYIRPQGTKSISANGSGIDVTEYASVNVAVPATTPTLQAKNYTVDSAGTQTVTADSGYDGLSSVAVSVPSADVVSWFDYGYTTVSGSRKWLVETGYVRNDGDDGNGWLSNNDVKEHTFNAVQANTTVTPSTSAQTIGGADYMMEGAVTVAAMPTGSATAPATISGTAATVSTGNNTLTLSKTVSVTPSVTAGYVSSGTAGNSSVSLTANVTTQAAQTIYPSASDQSIAASRYLTGAQTIKGVAVANLTAANVKQGVTVTIGDSSDADRIMSVTGTYSGGSSKNVQVAQSTTRVASTSYTKTASLTCSVTGTYDVYWDCFRSSTSGTNGSRLYIGGSEYGSANTTFSSSIHVQTNHLTGVSISANQEVAVYVRSRATNYYAYCGQLTIVQTA